jgi:formylmethanofuran dehydrogenase subunit E
MVALAFVPADDIRKSKLKNFQRDESIIIVLANKICFPDSTLVMAGGMQL